MFGAEVDIVVNPFESGTIESSDAKSDLTRVSRKPPPIDITATSLSTILQLE